MSIKSFIQIIILALMVSIIVGVYYKYFQSNENIVEEIRNKARDYLLKQAINPESLNMDAEPSKALLEMEGMTNDIAFELACRGIITIDDLADQSIDELMPIKNMTEELAGRLIMTARAPMFEGK